MRKRGLAHLVFYFGR